MTINAKHILLAFGIMMLLVALHGCEEQHPLQPAYEKNWKMPCICL